MMRSVVVLRELVDDETREFESGAHPGVEGDDLGAGYGITMVIEGMQIVRTVAGPLSSWPSLTASLLLPVCKVSARGSGYEAAG
jgi:hypothetical protein